jgi:hypothetical protein
VLRHKGKKIVPEAPVIRSKVKKLRADLKKVKAKKLLKKFKEKLKKCGGISESEEYVTPLPVEATPAVDNNGGSSPEPEIPGLNEEEEIPDDEQEWQDPALFPFDPVESATSTPLPEIPVLTSQTPLPAKTPVAAPPVPEGGFSFTITNSCSNRSVRGFSENIDILRSDLPLAYSLVAHANPSVQSVRFSYGATSRLDNSVPFSIFGDILDESTGKSDFLTGELPLGNTSIRISGYNSKDGSGQVVAEANININITDKPGKPASISPSSFSSILLPEQLKTVSQIDLTRSGCVRVSGHNEQGEIIAVRLNDETLEWFQSTPSPGISVDTPVFDNIDYGEYLPLVVTPERHILSYQKEPFECGYNGLKVFSNNVLIEGAKPFSDCVGFEHGSLISNSRDFILLGVEYTFSESFLPITGLRLVRLSEDGLNTISTLTLPFQISVNFMIHSITSFLNHSINGSVPVLAMALTVDDNGDPSVESPPLSPGTNVLFVSIENGEIIGHNVFAVDEEVLKIANLGLYSYSLVTLKPAVINGMEDMAMYIRIAR